MKRIYLPLLSILLLLSLLTFGALASEMPVLHAQYNVALSADNPNARGPIELPELDLEQTPPTQENDTPAQGENASPDGNNAPIEDQNTPKIVWIFVTLGAIALAAVAVYFVIPPKKKKQ
jgi:hypothetical protein